MRGNVSPQNSCQSQLGKSENMMLTEKSLQERFWFALAAARLAVAFFYSSQLKRKPIGYGLHDILSVTEPCKASFTDSEEKAIGLALNGCLSHDALISTLSAIKRTLCYGGFWCLMVYDFKFPSRQILLQSRSSHSQAAPSFVLFSICQPQ